MTDSGLWVALVSFSLGLHRQHYEVWRFQLLETNSFNCAPSSNRHKYGCLDNTATSLQRCLPRPTVDDPTVRMLGRIAGSLNDADVERHRRILESLTLPTTYPLGRWKTLLATMQRDKKARAGMMRFIVLDEIGKPATLAGPEEALLFAAYQEVGV